MSETNNTDKSLGAAPAKTTLHLKRPVEQGTVRQSFSHGRSKAVVVEKVKRRILTPGEAAAAGGPARHRFLFWSPRRCRSRGSDANDPPSRERPNSLRPV